MRLPTVLAAAVSALAGTGCTTPSVALAPSILPNLGVAASLSVPLRSGSPWELEGRFIDQFVDDKTFADNGFPEAGNWTQVDLGLLRVGSVAEERRWTLRTGLTHFRARGEPNVVEESGDYTGLYVGVGRFHVFSNGLEFGPELTVVLANGPDPFVLMPQLTWGLRWSPTR